MEFLELIPKETEYREIAIYDTRILKWSMQTYHLHEEHTMATLRSPAKSETFSGAYM